MLNGVSMAVGVMEMALYSSYTLEYFWWFGVSEINYPGASSLA